MWLPITMSSMSCSDLMKPRPLTTNSMLFSSITLAPTSRLARFTMQSTVAPEHMEVTDDMLECGCCELARLCEDEGVDDCLGLLRNVGDGITESECQAFVDGDNCPDIPIAKPVETKALTKRIAGN